MRIYLFTLSPPSTHSSDNLLYYLAYFFLLLFLLIISSLSYHVKHSSFVLTWIIISSIFNILLLPYLCTSHLRYRASCGTMLPILSLFFLTIVFLVFTRRALPSSLFLSSEELCRMAEESVDGFVCPSNTNPNSHLEYTYYVTSLLLFLYSALLCCNRFFVHVCLD